jgi:ribonuclease III
VSVHQFARRAGLTFIDHRLLSRALTHTSYINEHPEALEDNERLEFLGDAALDFVTAAWVYNRFPEMAEGQLTRLRSALVCTEQLAAFAGEIGLGEVLLLGRGEEASGGRERPALLCAGLEALMGALYLDQGLPAVSAFIQPRLERATRTILEAEALVDPRSQLQIWSQAELGETPRYQTVAAEGPDHARLFTIEVNLGGEMYGRGRGRSKQDAAQMAAAEALRRVGQPSSWDRGV